MSIRKSAAEIVASLKVNVEAGVVAKLDKHLTSVQKLIKPEWEPAYEELALIAFSGTLYLRFVPGLPGTAPTNNTGEGVFLGRSHPIPAIYLPGDPYRLLVSGFHATLFYGPFLAWSGYGEQFGLDSEYNVTFIPAPIIIT